MLDALFDVIVVPPPEDADGPSRGTKRAKEEARLLPLELKTDTKALVDGSAFGLVILAERVLNDSGALLLCTRTISSTITSVRAVCSTAQVF